MFYLAPAVLTRDLKAAQPGLSQVSHRANNMRRPESMGAATLWKLGIVLMVGLQKVCIVLFNMVHCCRYHIKCALRKHLKEQGIVVAL